MTARGIISASRRNFELQWLPPRSWETRTLLRRSSGGGNRKASREIAKMSSAHILRCYIFVSVALFRTPGIIQWLNDFYLFEGNQHVQFFTVQLDAQQNFTHLGSPAPQDLSKALFMAVTWRCNMPSQGHEPIGKDGKVDNPIEKPFGQNSSKVTTSTPSGSNILFYRVWWPVTFQCALWILLLAPILPGTEFPTIRRS